MLTEDSLKLSYQILRRLHQYLIIWERHIAEM
jgi:hypothetical protein